MNMLAKKPKKMKFLDAHTTTAAVVSCIDFRFRPHKEKLLKKTFNLSSFDLVSIAGGAACYALPGCSSRCQTVSDDVVLAAKAHHVKTVILLSHQNCGKVASCGFVFKNSTEEKKFHGESLREAAKKVKSALSLDSKVKIVLGFVSINPKTDKPRIEKITK